MQFIVQTGINIFEKKSNFSIYPNPANDNLKIESPEEPMIEITNIQGQIIKTFISVDLKTNIDISGVAKGIYFVKVKTAEGIAVKKFIKE